MNIEDILRAVRGELSIKGKSVFRDIRDTGANIMCTCPFHSGGQERNPSFGVLSEDRYSGGKVVHAGTGHCFTCGEARSLPALISELFGYNDGGEFGKQWLLDRFNFDTQGVIKFDLDLDISRWEDVSINHMEYFNPTHPYFATRNLTVETASMFELGFNPHTNSIVMPVKDKLGVCRMTIERNVDTKRFHNTSGTDKARLLFGLSEVYANLEYVVEVGAIYIAESAIDAMLLWQNGMPAVALMQAHPSDRQIELIREIPVETVVVATDNDDAGVKGFMIAKDKLGPTHKILRIVFPPHAKDIGDLSPKELSEVQVLHYETKASKKSLSMGEAFQDIFQFQ